MALIEKEIINNCYLTVVIYCQSLGRGQLQRDAGENGFEGHQRSLSFLLSLLPIAFSSLRGWTPHPGGLREEQGAMGDGETG